MNRYNKLLKLANRFSKYAQEGGFPQFAPTQEPTDANIKKVVIDTYNELAVGVPTDIRIDKQGNNITIWTNSWLSGDEVTLLSRLHSNFAPDDNIQFNVEYLDEADSNT